MNPKFYKGRPFGEDILMNSTRNFILRRVGIDTRTEAEKLEDAIKIQKAKYLLERLGCSH
jgi:predicted methyltransferase MtxX (methanogen marker protein 4)